MSVIGILEPYCFRRRSDSSITINMDGHTCRILAPLQDFPWDGEDFELAPGLWIKRFRKPPDLAGMDEWLAKDEWDRASGASHWLTYERATNDVPHPGEVENLVLLALWLTKPTRTQIAYRFELGLDDADGHKKRTRLFDRFMWIQNYTQFDIDMATLKASSGWYSAFSSMCQTRGRLNNALLLTIGGCWAHSWQVSLICHAAATEAILTYSKGPGITRRLAKTFACLTESDPTKRDIAFNNFVSAYTDRSDIMHGRPHNIAAEDRLPKLASFQDLLRTLWRTVCASPSLAQSLEDSDASRKTYLNKLEMGYTPPIP